MRKFLLLFFIPVTLSVVEASAQTNVYHLFPDSDAVWTVVDGMSHGGSHCDNIFCTRSYIQKGDTIINSIKYNKLYLNEHCTETWIVAPPPAVPCNWDYGIVTDVFTGGLRNDSANKKVYYYDKIKNLEYLLYNFNLTVGDTIQDWMGLGGYFKITSIDSVLVGVQYHKRFNIDGGINSDTSVIEGVGSLTGLLGPYYFFENFNQLICFSVLGQTKYINTNSLYQCGVIGINEIINTFSFSISPNPSSGIFRIKSEQEKINTLEIFNVLGEKIYSSHASLSVTDNIEIDLSKHPKGIYFVKIISGDKIVARKIILQ